MASLPVNCVIRPASSGATPSSPILTDKPKRQEEWRKGMRGKQEGLHARLKAWATRLPLPSLLLANFRSIPTWLNEDIPDTVISLQTHSVYQRDWIFASSKNKGSGVCIYVNNSWCSHVSVMHKYSSPNIELLMLKCWPFYLPREFIAIFITTVCIQPQAYTQTALCVIHDTINVHETTDPDAVFIIAGDFNHCKLRSVQNFIMPTFLLVNRTH